MECAVTATFFLLCHRPSFLLLVVNSEQQQLTLLSIKKKRKMKGQQQQKGFTGVQRHAGRTGFSHRRLNRRFYRPGFRFTAGWNAGVWGRVVWLEHVRVLIGFWLGLFQ